MYVKQFTKRFKKSVRRIIASRTISASELEHFIDQLASGQALKPKHRDHSLTGEWTGYRECHIKPDLLLIYKIEKQILILILADIGSHSDLF